ncbi:MAG: hypothetical protein V4568_09415 [Pseudomonadota bacterium]
MSAWRLLGSISIMALSGAIGWMLHEQLQTTKNISPQAIATTLLGASESERKVTLFSDGTVTINIQKRPLHWLYEELARQGGEPSSTFINTAGENPATTPAAYAAACTTPAPSEATEREHTQLIHTINSGDESKRYEGLLSAKSSGTALPENTLKTLVESDASDRVRLLAFENYLESKSGNPAETRAALQTALSNPSGKIQMEAKKFLEQFEELERMDANTPQATTQ